MTFDELERVLRAREDVDVGNGCDVEVVGAAERALGVVFPPELRRYLVGLGNLSLGHLEMFGLGEQIPKYLDVVTMTLSERTEAGCPLRADFVPLLNDGAGNLYCIGTVGPNAGGVFFWDHESGPGQEPERCAASLVEWIVDLLEELDAGAG